MPRRRSLNRQIASVMLYVGLVAFQIPGNIVAKSLSRIDIYIGCTCVGWGIASTLQAVRCPPRDCADIARLPSTRRASGSVASSSACSRPCSVCRAAVDLADVAVPAIPLYLSYFYTRREIGFRVALWVSSALSAGAFAGAIACAFASP